MNWNYLECINNPVWFNEMMVSLLIEESNEAKRQSDKSKGEKTIRSIRH